jgi:hypothetical protein
VRRFALTVSIALLTFSASGVHALVIAEPCTIYEQGRDEGGCPPTCVTCGCCAQAVEPVSLTVTTALETAIGADSFFLPGVPKTTPRDILHVPKLLGIVPLV